MIHLLLIVPHVCSFPYRRYFDLTTSLPLQIMNQDESIASSSLLGGNKMDLMTIIRDPEKYTQRKQWKDNSFQQKEQPKPRSYMDDMEEEIGDYNIYFKELV